MLHRVNESTWVFSNQHLPVTAADCCRSPRRALCDVMAALDESSLKKGTHPELDLDEDDEEEEDDDEMCVPEPWVRSSETLDA